MRLTIAFNDWLEVKNEHGPPLKQLSISKALKQPLATIKAVKQKQLAIVVPKYRFQKVSGCLLACFYSDHMVNTGRRVGFILRFLPRAIGQTRFYCKTIFYFAVKVKE